MFKLHYHKNILKTSGVLLKFIYYLNSVEKKINIPQALLLSFFKKPGLKNKKNHQH